MSRADQSLADFPLFLTQRDLIQHSILMQLYDCQNQQGKQDSFCQKPYGGSGFLPFPAGEFGMMVFDLATATCQHNKEAYHYWIDEENAYKLSTDIVSSWGNLFSITVKTELLRYLVLCQDNGQIF